MAETQSERHESVLALIAEAQLNEDADAVIRRKARAIIAKYESLWKGPPYCPEELADLESIIVEEVDCDIKSDGRIFSRGGQVIIQHAGGQSKERVRFTIFHELAHTLFPDCFDRVRERTKAEKAFQEFENLCNTGASEFLFPVNSFRADLGGRFPNAEKINSLAKRYEASVDATVWRLIDLTQQPACAVFADYSEPTGKNKTSLKVRYSVANKKFPVKIHPNYRINSKSGANRAFSEESPASVDRENWRVGGEWWNFRIDALPLVQVSGKDLPNVVIVVRYLDEYLRIGRGRRGS